MSAGGVWSGPDLITHHSSLITQHFRVATSGLIYAMMHNTFRKTGVVAILTSRGNRQHNNAAGISKL